MGSRSQLGARSRDSSIVLESCRVGLSATRRTCQHRGLEAWTVRRAFPVEACSRCPISAPSLFHSHGSVSAVTPESSVGLHRGREVVSTILRSAPLDAATSAPGSWVHGGCCVLCAVLCALESVRVKPASVPRAGGAPSQRGWPHRSADWGWRRAGAMVKQLPSALAIRTGIGVALLM